MTNKSYPEEFKIEAVKQITERGHKVAEVAARITADLPTLVTVFMTGFSDRLRALETVGAMTLAKPFSRDDLRAAVTKVLGARGQAGSADSIPGNGATA